MGLIEIGKFHPQLLSHLDGWPNDQKQNNNNKKIQMKQTTATTDEEIKSVRTEIERGKQRRKIRRWKTISRQSLRIRSMKTFSPEKKKK